MRSEFGNMYSRLSPLGTIVARLLPNLVIATSREYEIQGRHMEPKEYPSFNRNICLGCLHPIRHQNLTSQDQIESLAADVVVY